SVGKIIFNRPKALNALNSAVITEMNMALDHFEADLKIGAIILTGNDKAFAAGADIREMKDKTFEEVTSQNFLQEWDHINTIAKPLIAAVSGFALGGGFECALACDIILASETAKFALPETTLGIIPGVGGTQRLVQAIGKSKAMDLILTGRMMDANEAERIGIVARIVSVDQLQDEALKLATKIASLSQPVVKAAKQAVLSAYEMPLREGLKLERKLIHSMFALEDQKEGMAAFLEKRPAKFQNK
ncbi:MAG: enoyl-CoA hydratase/isomerase family protein, partial [Alphaproteobacteria bacterium]|nr:enoyl-CoA hydratase/isomerase family protein [Alphaproteobacteria bacterium]